MPNQTTTTSTPEEVKNKVAIKHGYLDWQDAVTRHVHGFTQGLLNEMENEAMQSYAEAFHKAEVEKAGEDLPESVDAGNYFSGIPKITANMLTSFNGGVYEMRNIAVTVLAQQQQKAQEDAVIFLKWIFKESSYETESGEIYYVRDGITFNCKDMYKKYKEETK